jgi:hypothetical protein
MPRSRANVGLKEVADSPAFVRSFGGRESVGRSDPTGPDAIYETLILERPDRRQGSALREPADAARGTSAMELARARTGVAERPVVELGWKARHDCLGRLAPEPEELESEDLSRLPVSLAVAGNPVEAHRLTPDDTARTSVGGRPPERFEPARDNGDVLLHGNRERAGVHLSRVAEPLPCPLDKDAHNVSLADKFPRLA